MDRAASLGIVALLAHARSVPSEARERFAGQAAALADDPRTILLRTCHRVELYVAVPDDPDERTSLRLPALPEGGRAVTGHEALRHLFSVAAGLDSIVIGEDQILHQLRDCLSSRHGSGSGSCAADCEEDPVRIPEGPLDPVLERLFQLGLHVGRRSRAWREGPPRSLSDVALDRVERHAGQLDGARLLVVGAGRMSRLAAIGAARRGAHVQVTNRTLDRAEALAADVNGGAVPWGATEAVRAADGIVVAIWGDWALGADSRRALIESAAPVVDLSSPPALGPDLREALGERYTSVDDLARGPHDEVRARLRNRIEGLLEEAERDYVHWYRGRTSAPAIQALTAQAESRRAAEVDRLLRRMPHLAGRDRELVEQMSRRLVAGLLHAPLTTLRDDDTGARERAARDLFSL
jgi:glutamyl-tRNA reductase